MPEQHDMMLVGKTESGAERWQCPQCGRTMLMRWPPQFESRVTEEGDTSVAHRGVKGAVQMGAVDVAAVPPPVADEDERWLRQNGIDWYGAA